MGHRRSATGHSRRLTHRAAVVGALVGALLVTGCSGDSDGSSNNNNSNSSTGAKGTKPSSSAPGVAGSGAVLDDKQVAAVLPRQGDLPGWEGHQGHDPTVNLRTQEWLPVSCVKRKDPICPGALFATSTMFTRPDAGTITVTVYAYDKVSAAMGAAVPMLDQYAAANLLPDSIHDSRLPAEIGDSSRAKRGTSKLRSQASVTVSRVGTTLLIVETGGLNAKIYVGAELVALGKVIAERSRQVQNGETPTAKLKDGVLDYRKLGAS
ncbi:hypothetical protein ACIQ9E_16145 [Streptomyces sp. NPDC094448]|uniref:hypothetical protein n=1 Tax=Streptomyces sp. NPDC094448 TaxID=3366063 RepID=UPI00382364CB